MFGFLFRSSRRNHLRAAPVPAVWPDILKRCVPLFARLPKADQAELLGHMQVFLDEKSFEGCGGLVLTEEMRVTIAAQACMLLLHRDAEYFPKMGAILVYPGAYITGQVEHDEHGFEDRSEHVNLGESWGHGSVILSWEDVLLDAEDPDDGFNVTLHEFAHQLDMEDGTPNGVPMLAAKADYADWARVMKAEFDKLTEFAQWVEVHHHALLAHHREERKPLHEAFENKRDRHPKLGRLGEKHRPFHLLDPYGAEDPAEFFAVATESFFEEGAELKQHHPELYAQLAKFYRQDPAGWGE